jgi:hypothetical protein
MSRWITPSRWAKASAGPHDPEALVEGAGQVVHDEVHGIVLAPDGEDADDVRVTELRGGGGLAPEAALEDVVARVLGLEDLDGDGDVELRIVALVDPGEPAGADDGIDAEAAEVAAEEALRQAREPLQVREAGLNYCASMNSAQRHRGTIGEYT